MTYIELKKIRATGNKACVKQILNLCNDLGTKLTQDLSSQKKRNRKLEAELVFLNDATWALREHKELKEDSQYGFYALSMLLQYHTISRALENLRFKPDFKEMSEQRAEIYFYLSDKDRKTRQP